MVKDQVFITGSTGKLGRELKKLFPSALTPTHEELDVTDGDAVFTYFKKNKIGTVIHTSAVTSVVRCERDRRLAYNVNVQGTRNVYDAYRIEPTHSHFIYVSTACVFPGTDPTKTYFEDDLPYPTNYYGLTKLLGEYVVGYSGSSLIVRTNFVERGSWTYPQAFTDRFGTYLYSDQVARQIKVLSDFKVKGVVHVCGNKRMSMYELSRLMDPTVKTYTLPQYRRDMGDNYVPLTVNMCLGSKYQKPMDIERAR